MAENDKIKDGPIKDIHKGHRQRVLKELVEFGISEDVRPHKVLEAILFFTIPRKDTSELAYIVWEYFGRSFTRVMEASVEELVASSQTDRKDIPKISEYTARHIKSIMEIAKYYYREKAKEEKWTLNRREGAVFLFKNLVDKNVETVYMLCLDNTNRFLACPKLSEGDEFEASVSPRTLIKKVTQIGATKVLIAHNHPRGNALPSEADLITTRRLAVALSGIGARLIDHIIVADKDFVSIRDSSEYEYLFKL